MRPSRIVSASNWKYAIGEVCLIVVGVSIALMANSWYENRQERRNELASLRQLEIALDADLARAVQLAGTLGRVNSDIHVLLEALEGKTALKKPLGAYLGDVSTWYGGDAIRLAPYEEIKNHGFELISKDSLRGKLIDLYESRWPRLSDVAAADEEYSAGAIREYFYRRFPRAIDGGWNVDDSLETLRTDVYFKNLVIGKVSRFDNWFIRACEDFIVAAEDILAEVRSEIVRLSN